MMCGTGWRAFSLRVIQEEGVAQPSFCRKVERTPHFVDEARIKKTLEERLKNEEQLAVSRVTCVNDYVDHFKGSREINYCCRDDEYLVPPFYTSGLVWKSGASVLENIRGKSIIHLFIAKRKFPDIYANSVHSDRIVVDETWIKADFTEIKLEPGQNFVIKPEFMHFWFTSSHCRVRESTFPFLSTRILPDKSKSASSDSSFQCSLSSTIFSNPFVEGCTKQNTELQTSKQSGAVFARKRFHDPLVHESASSKSNSVSAENKLHGAFLTQNINELRREKAKFEVGNGRKAARKTEKQQTLENFEHVKKQIQMKEVTKEMQSTKNLKLTAGNGIKPPNKSKSVSCSSFHDSLSALSPQGPLLQGSTTVEKRRKQQSFKIPADIVKDIHIKEKQLASEKQAIKKLKLTAEIQINRRKERIEILKKEIELLKANKDLQKSRMRVDELEVRKKLIQEEMKNKKLNRLKN